MVSLFSGALPVQGKMQDTGAFIRAERMPQCKNSCSRRFQDPVKWGLRKPRVLRFSSPSPLSVACILSSSLGITTPPCAYFIVIRQEGIFYLLPWKYPLSVNGCNTACTLVPPPFLCFCLRVLHQLYSFVIGEEECLVSSLSPCVCVHTAGFLISVFLFVSD